MLKVSSEKNKKGYQINIISSLCKTKKDDNDKLNLSVFNYNTPNSLKSTGNGPQLPKDHLDSISEQLEGHQ